MKNHYETCISYNEKHLIEGGLQFRGLVHYYGGQLGSKQEDMVLVRQVIVIYLYQQEKERPTQPNLNVSNPKAQHQ